MEGCPSSVAPGTTWLRTLRTSAQRLGCHNLYTTCAELAPPSGTKISEMNFTILSCSLATESRSRAIARRAEQLLAKSGHLVSFIDLRERPLPHFDNDTAFDHPSFSEIHQAIDTADGVFIASPVYNWGVGSVAKNLVEITGATGENGRRAAWFDKVVTFLCSGGLPNSYMAYGSMAFSLMLDFKCVINPYAVYADNRDFSNNGEFGSRLVARIEKTVAAKIEISEALKQRTYRSDWEV